MHYFHVLLQVGQQFAAIGTGLLVGLLVVVGHVHPQRVGVGVPLSAQLAHCPIPLLVHLFDVSLQVAIISESFGTVVTLAGLVVVLLVLVQFANVVERLSTFDASELVYVAYWVHQLHVHR